MLNMVIKSITISKAKVSDSQVIRKLEKKVWSEEVVNKYDSPMLVRFGYVYVAKHEKKIVGAIIAYPTKDNEIYVCDWVVDSKYRGMNIGQRLYERLFKDVREKSIVSFIDPDNFPSMKTHLKLGFRVVRKIKNPYALNEGYRIFVRKNLTKNSLK